MKPKQETAEHKNMPGCAMPGCFLSGDSLWGSCGGQLEYVGQKIVTRSYAAKTYTAVVLYFTDHDKAGIGEPSISDEFYAHYSMELPVAN